jgi:uncharacterized protein YhaN
VRLVACVASRGGTFKSREIAFKPGLTVICGPNDSGKTLLARSLIDLLFGSFDCEYKGDPGFWNGFFLSATIEIEKNKYRFERNAQTSLTIYDETSSDRVVFQSHEIKNGIVSESQAPEIGHEKLRRLIDRYPYRFFNEVGFLNSPLAGSGPLSFETLRGFLIDSNSNFYKAFEKLGAFSGENSSFNREFNGAVLTQESELKSVDKEIQIHELKSTRTKKINYEKKDIETELVGLTALDDKYERARERVFGIQYRQKEIELASGEIEKIILEMDREQEKIDHFNVVKEKLLSLFPQFSQFTDSQKDNLGKIQSTYRSIRDAHERIEKITSGLSRIARRLRRNILCIALLGLSSAIIVFFAPLRLAFQMRDIILVSISGSAFILTILSFIRYRVSLKKFPLSDALVQKNVSEENLKKILCENQVPVDGLVSEEAYEFLLQYFEEYGFYSDQENETQAIEQTLKDSLYFSESKGKIKELSEKTKKLSAEIKHDIETLAEEFALKKSDTVIDEVITIIEDKRNKTRGAIENANEILSRLGDENSESYGEDSDIRNLAEKRRAYGSRLLSLYALDRTIRFARDFMAATTEKHERELFAACTHEALSIFNRLSGNQHVTTINAATFSRFYRGEFTPPNPSVTHMMQLATKLALSGIMLDEGICVPLILDEPMMHMDTNRVKKCIEIVREYSEKRQMIVLTHDRESFRGIDLVDL